MEAMRALKKCEEGVFVGAAGNLRRLVGAGAIWSFDHRMRIIASYKRPVIQDTLHDGTRWAMSAAGLEV
jgi:hypothetical protein